MVILNTSKKIEPPSWPGSQHEESSVLFEKHKIKTATSEEALRGLHTKTSSLEKPVQPAGWNYVEAPRVSILIPQVDIGKPNLKSGFINYLINLPKTIYRIIFGKKTQNKYKIPEGRYLIINRANRAPLKDKWKLEETYEFPGRAYKLKMDEEIKTSSEAAALTAAHELGTEENLKLEQLAKNVSACGGNNSLIYDFYSAKLKEKDINQLVETNGAELDSTNGVIKINRKCDGGIIDGIELVPLNHAMKYFKELEQTNKSIASTTYAALKLLNLKD